MQPWTSFLDAVRLASENTYRAGENQLTTPFNTIQMKHFLEAVQKHTMGETSEIFVNHQDVVRLTEEPPKSNVLKSAVGPFKRTNGIQIMGKSAASAYCNLTLHCIYQYIDEGHIFKQAPGYCIMHGGLAFPDKDVFERCIANAIQRIKQGNDIRTADVEDTASFNDVHRLGFGGSVITGRLPVHEACTGNENAPNAMHARYKTTVVGHTPQWLGIPTVIREKHKFLIVLDTQFSDRQKNTHSLGLFKDGSFCLRGSWMNCMTYTARSDDVHIGRKIQVVSDGFKSSTDYFRVIAKSENDTQTLYIAVNYEPSSVAPRGKTTVCLVNFTNDGFVVNVASPEPKLVQATQSTFISSGTVTLQEDHKNDWKSHHTMGLGDNPGSETQKEFDRFVCGDIESSVDFLRAFLMHSYTIATGVEFDQHVLQSWNDEWQSELDLTEFGFETDNSLGFDPRTISDAMKEVMTMSHHMVKEGGMKFACIGDVIGDPVGQGNRFNTTGTELVHEFMCVHWANKYCLDKIIGNRDINKLRFLQEIPYILKSHNVVFFKQISDLQQEFAIRNMKNVVTLKRLLGHFCYPYVDGEQGVKLSKHFLHSDHGKILPFTDNGHPSTIWDYYADIR